MAEGDIPINLADFADPSYKGYQESIDESTARQAGVSWADYGHTLAGATVGLGAGLAGYADRWGLLDQQGQYNKQYLEDLQKEQQEQLSPSAQEATQKGLFETSRPGAHIMLGLTSMAPSLIAAVVPSTMVARAIGMAGGFGATLATAAGSAPVSASMAGEVFNNIQNEVKESDDKTLRANNPFYNGLRSDGMAEDEARRKTVDHIAGWKPEIMGAVAEAAARFGPAFQSAARATGVAGRGVLRGAGLGAVEQGLGQGALAGTSDVITQSGKQGVHPELEMNWREALGAAVEGGTLGAITGVATGAIHGMGAPKPLPKKPANVDQDAATAIAALPQNKPLAEAEATPAGEPAFAPAGGTAPADEAGAAPPLVAKPTAEAPPAEAPPAATVVPKPAAEATAPPAAPSAAPGPPVPKGSTRFYHGGTDPTSGGGRWLTPDYQYARDYGQGNNEVHYVDVPTKSPLLKKAFDDQGLTTKAPFISFEAPETIAKKLKPIEPPAKPPAPASESPVATPTEAARPQEEIPSPGATAKPAEAKPPEPAGAVPTDPYEHAKQLVDSLPRGLRITVPSMVDLINKEVGVDHATAQGLVKRMFDEGHITRPGAASAEPVPDAEPAKAAKAKPAEPPPTKQAAPSRLEEIDAKLRQHHEESAARLREQLAATTDPVKVKALQEMLDIHERGTKEAPAAKEAPEELPKGQVLEDKRAKARERKGERVSATEAAAAAKGEVGLKGFASSGHPKADLAAWSGEADKRRVKRLVQNELAAAKSAGTEPREVIKNLAESAYAEMRGKGPEIAKNKKTYLEHRADLAREEGAKLEAGKTERGTAEAKTQAAREEALASHEAQAQMAGTIIRDHKPPSLADESGAETAPAMLRLKMRQHIDTVLKAAEVAGVDIPKTRQAAKDDEPLLHLMELKRLRESIAEKDWGKLTKEQAAARKLAMHEAITDATLLRAGKEGEVKERRAAESKKSEATYGEELGTGKIEASYEGPHGGLEAAPDEEDKPLARLAAQQAEEAKQATAAEARETAALAKEQAEDARRQAERAAARAERLAKASSETAVPEAPKAAAAKEVSRKRGRTVVTLKGKADLPAELAHADSVLSEQVQSHPSLPEKLRSPDETRELLPPPPKKEGPPEYLPSPLVKAPSTLPYSEPEIEKKVKPLQTVKLGEQLQAHAPAYNKSEKLPGLRWLTNTMRTRIIKMVGDMDVHILSDEDFKNLHEYGVGIYVGEAHQIHVRASVFTYDSARIHEALMHEGVHAAFMHVLNTSPDLRKEVKKLVAHLESRRGELLQQGWTKRDLYGLTDEHEFVAEAFSNPRFQQLLKSVDFRASREMTQSFVDMRGAKLLQSMWQRLRGIVRRSLRMTPAHDTMLDRAMDVGHILDWMREYRAQKDFPLTYKEQKAYLQSEEAFVKGGAQKLPSAEHPPERLRTLDPTDPPEQEARGALGEFANRVKTAISGTGFSDMARNALDAVTSADQLRQRGQGMFHGEGEGNVVHDLYYSMMKKGHYTDELRKTGEDLNADLIDVREKVGLETFKRFENMILDASWNGMDPSTPLGAGRNEHLAISKGLAGKVKSKGWGAVANEASRTGWQARGKWAEANKEYRDLVAKHPEMHDLMNRSFDYFADAQKEMAQGAVENLLRGNLYKGDIKAKAEELLSHPGGQDFKDAIAKDPELGEDFLAELLRQRELNVTNGPYAPFMRRGNWVTHGRYKIEAPKNATRLSHNEFEFATRKEAHDFAANHDLHLAESHTRYYNPDDPSLGAEAGKRTTREGLTSAGNPVEREYVRLEDQYVKFHPNEKEAKRDYEALKASGLMREVYSPEVRQNGVFQSSELTRSSLALIDKRLQQNIVYQDASPGQRQAMRQALQEASLAARAGVRMQHRRLPRRHVLGYSDDFMQTLYEYNNSQANFRSLQKYRPLIDDALMRMRREQEDRRNESGNTERSIAAAQWEKRARLEDPNADISKVAGFTRRANMLSYLDRMLRPSHLLLHQTHLPMITAPAMFGRHGMQTYAEIMKAWRGASGAYKTGIMDTWGSLKQALPKAMGFGGRKALTFRGTDYDAFMDNAFKGEKDGSQLLQLFDTARKSNLMHITGGVEIGKYGPTVEGPLGYADRALAKMDTIYRHASNAADSMIRHAALVAAFRLERDKLTQQGKFTRAEVMNKATQYAMDVVSNTQGNYAVNNAAPIFQNKFLRPLLQFKQFPQMMYHLLVKNTVDAFKGETKEARRAAAKSLFAVLASHTIMTGFLGGLPLELPRAVLALSKGLGVTSFDMQDFEDKEKEILHSMFGQLGGDLMLNGLSRAIGVDAHHRLGLNSFFTFGIDDVHDWNSFAGFMLNQAAPVGLAKDLFQGTTKMLHGDFEEGAAKAFPLQALRDIRKAWTGTGAGGYQYTPIERGWRGLGFTPAGEAASMEATSKAVKDAEAKKDERSKAMGVYFRAVTPEQTAAATKAIDEYNKHATGRNHIGVKGLEAIKKSRQKQQDEARSQF